MARGSIEMDDTPAIAELLSRLGFRRFELSRTGVGHLMLGGRIDERPVDFVLDTGASSTFVELGYCRSQGIAVTDTGQPGHGGTIHKLGDVQLSLGALPIRTNGIFAIDMTGTNQRLTAKGFDPIRACIGQDVLRHHRAVIDYAALALFLKERPDAP